jgi:putative hydrolase of HD superfamily
MKDYSLEEAILIFANMVGRAKNLARTGWKEKAQIESPESIADHMYRTAVISMVLSDIQGLDTERVLKMCLLDDLAETITGDLTPGQKKRGGLAKSRKREEDALRQLLAPLPRSLGERYIATWREAQSMRSKEARLVKSSDKLEMAIQAQEYISQDYSPKKLGQFITSAGRKIRDPKIMKLLDVLKRRPKLISPT